jgi:hypothetical protein
MTKFLLKIIVMIILLGVSFALLGTGVTTYLINTVANTVTSFTGIFGGVSSGQSTIESVMNFNISIVQTIGIILFYYIIAHVITGIFVKKK